MDDYSPWSPYLNTPIDAMLNTPLFDCLLKLDVSYILFITRNYITPSATSRKEVPAVFAHRRGRSTAFTVRG
jgi:hypothetical protein